MFKLLVAILGIFAISLALLHLRQRELGYRHQINLVHDQMEGAQGRLWNQQVGIARETSPGSLRDQLKDRSATPDLSPDSPDTPWMQRRIYRDKKDE